MTRIARAAALALVAVAALTGCIRYDVDLTLNSDDTATGSLILAVKEGTAEAVGAESDAAVLDEMLASEDLGEGFTESDFTEDEWIGKKYTFDNVPLDEFDAFNDLFTITRDGDTFVIAGDQAPATEEDQSMAQSGAESTLRITFPGDVKSHNGTVEGKTVSWNLLTTTEPISAEGGATSGGIPVGLIAAIAGGALVLAAVAVVLVLVLRKKRETEAFSEVPPAEAPPAFEPGSEEPPTA